jgi:PB1 domain
VDVLKLTYATLEQMSSLVTKDVDTAEGNSGPLWGRFFESLASHDDAESTFSGSNAKIQSHTTPPASRRTFPVQESPHSELFPGDSASAVEEVTRDTAGEVPLFPSVTISSVSRNKEASVTDDGTYVFKFHTPSGRTHRFQALKNDVGNLKDIVGGKLEVDPFFTVSHEEGMKPNPREFQLAYTDLDGDLVIISSNEDVEDSVKFARKKGSDRVLLQLQGGRGWEASTSVIPESVRPTSAGPDVSGSQAEVANVPPGPKVHAPQGNDLYGVPKDLLLPVSIAGLAAVIVAVFTISRLTRD